MASSAGTLFESFRDGDRVSLSRIRSAVDGNEPESQFLEFKENRDKSGAVSVLTSDSRTNLGKCLSAFANTAGGVLVWGVESKDDKANGYAPIPDINMFLQSLNGQTSSCVEPVVEGFLHLGVEDDRIAGHGYAVTYVPESRRKPHQCVATKATTNYYLRVGSNVEAMPHSIVRALFSERAKPQLDVVLGAEFKYGQKSPPEHPDGVKWIVGGKIFLRNRGDLLAHTLGFAVSPADSRITFKSYWSAAEAATIFDEDRGEFGWQANMYSAPVNSVIFPGMSLEIGELSAVFFNDDLENGPVLRYAMFAQDFSVQGTISFPVHLWRKGE